MKKASGDNHLRLLLERYGAADAQKGYAENEPWVERSL